MISINDVKMKPKLIGSFLIAGIVPLVIVSFLSINKSEKALMTKAFEQLKSVQHIKKNQIAKYFEQKRTDIEMLAEDDQIHKFFMEVDNYGEQEFARTGRSRDLFPIGTDKYKSIIEKYDKYYADYIQKYGYYDLFLICPDHGYVMYTVAKESDLGANLKTGSLRNSGLGKLLEEVKKNRDVAFIDFEPYAPSGNIPASFIGAPMFDKDGTLFGIIALQISIDAINEIMQEREGMGETGETYLVGPDKRMRSDSYLDPTGHSIVASFAGTIEKNGVDTEASDEALTGRDDEKVILDYNGNPVLSCYAPLDIFGIRWAIIAEIDLAEVQAPGIALRNSIIWFSLIIAVLTGLFGMWMGTGIANPIQLITQGAKRLSGGDAELTGIDRNEIRKVNSRRDELGDVGKAFSEMIEYFKEMTNASKNIANGNLSTDVNPRGETDLLGNAMVKMVQTLNDMNAEVQMLINASIEGKLDVRGDSGKFQGAYAAMIEGINNILEAIVKPIGESSEVLAEMAEGNLMEYVSGDYKGDFAQIKESMNSTLDSLNEILGQVYQSVEQVSSGSNQVSESSQALSQGATEQASTLEELSSSIQEMSGQTKLNSENADQASKLAMTARTSASTGADKMTEMNQAMNDINETSKEITKVIKVIDEIAFQTNLLALNAAVEAARAGVHGKGFAVVADEVRNLAQRSAKAAQETTELIENSVKKAEEGTRIAEETSKALEEIVTGVSKVSDLIGEIASASKEQAEGINQINEGLSQVDEVTQQAAANAEELASASEELSSQAVQLKTMISRFKINKSDLHVAERALSGRRAEDAAHKSLPAASGSGKAKKGKKTGTKPKKKTPPKKAMEVSPEEIISLEDEDFGKF